MSDSIQNYPSNTHKNKELESKRPQKDAPEKQKMEKVVDGEHRKKGLGKRISETFTGDDARSVGEYVLFDVVIPAAKTMISDAVGQGVERMLFGDIRRPRSSGTSTRTNYTNYNRMRPASTSPGRAFEPDGPALSKRARASHDFGEIVLPDRGKAEVVLERMGDALDAYGVVTVTDFYDLVGITGSYTDDKWGWYDLRGARAVRDRAGYLVDLPAPSPVD